MGQVRKGTEGVGVDPGDHAERPVFEIREASSSTDFVQANYKLLRRDRARWCTSCPRP